MSKEVSEKVIEKKYLDVLDEVRDICKQIVTSKRSVYKDAWYDIPWRTLDHVIAYKARRMTRIPRKHLAKLVDDHIDIINLAVMALVQIKEEMGRLDYVR